MAITLAQREALIEMYVAIPGRAPDADGLAFWADALENGASFAFIAQEMWESAPAQALYPASLTVTETVTAIYENVLGRSPDPDGLAYWVGRWNANGSGNEGATMQEMITSIKTWAPADPDNLTALDIEALAAQQLFADKVEFGEWFAIVLGSNNIDLAELGFEVLENGGTIAEAQLAVSGPDTTTGLTAGQDTVVGTAGNDLVKGLVDGAASTFTLGDSIDGGAGLDTLELSVGTDAVNLGIAAITNVEYLDIKVFDDSFDDLNLANKAFTKATVDFGNNMHDDSLDIYNVNKGTALVIQNVDFDGYDIDIEYAGSAAINNSLTLTNVANADIDVYVNQATVGGTYTLILDNVTDTDFYTEMVKTLNVVVNGDSSGMEIMNYSGFAGADAVVNVTLNADLHASWWDLPDSGNTTLFNITGSGNLTIDEFDDGSSAITIDGSTATGNIDITDDSGTIVSVTTGSGNDRIVLDAGYFVATSGLVVALGAGTDTLAISGVNDDVDLAALDFDDVTLTGIEALEFVNDITLAADAPIDMGTVGDAEKLVFASFDGAGFELTVANASAVFAIEASGDLLDTYLAIDGVTDLSINVADESVIWDIDAADLVNLSLHAGDVSDTYLGNTVGYDLSSLETLTVTGADAFDDSYHWVEIEAGASALTDVSITGNWSGLYVDGAAALETVTLTGGSDFYGSDAYLEVYNAESLTTATLSGLQAEVYLTDTEAFKTLDLSAISDYAYVDVSAAAFASAVTISIGVSDVDYYANTATTSREIFKFVGDDIGAITIDDFEAGAGANRDRIDFSVFAGISSTEDLIIVDNGTDTTITAADGQFAGEIVLLGVLADAALSESLLF